MLQVEIAKNVVLFGLKGCVLHDTEVVTALDLSAQFYLSEASIGANRAEACVAAVAELNPSVAVSARVPPRGIGGPWTRLDPYPGGSGRSIELLYGYP